MLEFPFASLETCEIVFNSVNVDPPINPSRTTKELRLEEISSSSSEEEEGESTPDWSNGSRGSTARDPRPRATGSGQELFEKVNREFLKEEMDKDL